MEGRFLRKKFNGWLFLIFVSGLICIATYFFVIVVDQEATGKTAAPILIMGILILLAAISSWLFNFKAFIRVDADSVKSRYHWFGRIDCKMADIAFVLPQQPNTLIIQLKNGKTYTIMGLEDPYPLASMIRRNISFESAVHPEALREEMARLKRAKKKYIICSCAGIAMMFIYIFIAALLTDEGETQSFSRTDWTVFAILCVVELAIGTVTFYFADKAGKCNFPIEKLRYTLRKRVIETQPLLPGFVIAVYTDENYTGRVTLYGYPHDSAVYYLVQEFDPDYTLFRARTSGIYDNQKELSPALDELIDITKNVLN